MKKIVKSLNNKNAKSKFSKEEYRHKAKICPNCGHKSLRKFMDMWLCHECEYHSRSLKKKAKGSFR